MPPIEVDIALGGNAEQKLASLQNLMRRLGRGQQEELRLGLAAYRQQRVLVAAVNREEDKKAALQQFQRRLVRDMSSHTVLQGRQLRQNQGVFKGIANDLRLASASYSEQADLVKRISDAGRTILLQERELAAIERTLSQDEREKREVAIAEAKRQQIHDAERLAILEEETSAHAGKLAKLLGPGGTAAMSGLLEKGAAFLKPISLLGALGAVLVTSAKRAAELNKQVVGTAMAMGAFKDGAQAAEPAIQALEKGAIQTGTKFAVAAKEMAELQREMFAGGATLDQMTDQLDHFYATYRLTNIAVSQQLQLARRMALELGNAEDQQRAIRAQIVAVQRMDPQKRIFTAAEWAEELGTALDNLKDTGANLEDVGNQILGIVHSTEVWGRGFEKIGKLSKTTLTEIARGFASTAKMPMHWRAAMAGMGGAGVGSPAFLKEYIALTVGTKGPAETIPKLAELMRTGAFANLRALGLGKGKLTADENPAGLFTVGKVLEDALGVSERGGIGAAGLLDWAMQNAGAMQNIGDITKLIGEQADLGKSSAEILASLQAKYNKGGEMLIPDSFLNTIEAIKDDVKRSASDTVVSDVHQLVVQTEPLAFLKQAFENSILPTMALAQRWLFAKGGIGDAQEQSEFKLRNELMQAFGGRRASYFRAQGWVGLGAQGQPTRMARVGTREGDIIEEMRESLGANEVSRSYSRAVAAEAARRYDASVRQQRAADEATLADAPGLLGDEPPPFIGPHIAGPMGVLRLPELAARDLERTLEGLDEEAADLAETFGDMNRVPGTGGLKLFPEGPAARYPSTPGQFYGNFGPASRRPGPSPGVAANGNADLYQSVAREVARKLSIPEDVFLGMGDVESRWNPNAVSPQGAMGLFQMMPGTWKDWGSGDPMNPSDNIQAGGRYFKWLLDRYNGDAGLAVMAYHQGPGTVDAWLRGTGSIGPKGQQYAADVAERARRHREVPMEGEREFSLPGSSPVKLTIKGDTRRFVSYTANSVATLKLFDLARNDRRGGGLPRNDVSPTPSGTIGV